jgi:hypothetical protein
VAANQVAQTGILEIAEISSCFLRVRRIRHCCFHSGQMPEPVAAAMRSSVCHGSERSGFGVPSAVAFYLFRKIETGRYSFSILNFSCAQPLFSKYSTVTPTSPSFGCSQLAVVSSRLG